MYNATVAEITSIRKHPNADRLQLALVCGSEVIVGLDSKVGDLGIYFPTDGQLSEEYAKANNLISYKDPVTGEKKGGFFDQKRKVRAQKFRGAKSDGYFAPISSLNFILGFNEYDFQVGKSFDEYNGVKICNKYYTPATLRVMAKQREGSKQNMFNTFEAPSFRKHVDTEHWSRNYQFIPDKSILYFTEKLHGTSFRFGQVWVKRNNYFKLPFYKKWLTKLGMYNPVTEGFEYVNGTRNTILQVNDKQFYSNESFRTNVVKDLIGRLFEGEVLYGEIVGFTHGDSPIMPPHSTEKLGDKDIEKKYGKTMLYKYGCNVGEAKIYIYRITRTDKLGNTVELSWPQVKARCTQLGINYVPEMVVSVSGNEIYLDNGTPPYKNYFESHSQLDSSHIMEGVAIRVETPDGRTYFLKEKSYTFKVLEGIIKEQDDYIDTEEIS